jgi:hypothetical protein
MKAKQYRNDNMEFDFERIVENPNGNSDPHASGGLSDEGWRLVRAALDSAREDDRTRKLLIEMKPLSYRVQ